MCCKKISLSIGCGCGCNCDCGCKGSNGSGSNGSNGNCCDNLNSRFEELLDCFKEMAKCCDCDCGDGGEPSSPGKAEITLLGGTGTDKFHAIMSTENSYIVCGETNSAGAGSYDGLLAVFDKNLGTVNKTTIGTANEDRLMSMAPTPDGGVLAVGQSVATGVSSQFFLAVFDKNMNLTHKHLLGGTGSEILTTAKATPSNFNGTAKYVTVGYGNSNLSSYDAFIATYDGDFNILKKMQIGGTGEDQFRSVAANEDGFVAVGLSHSVSTKFDGLIVQYDPDLNIKKKLLIGGSGDDVFYSIIRITNGYAITGYTKSAGEGDYDVLILILDDDLNIVKKSVMGKTGSDTAYSIAQTSNGGYVLSGSTNSVGSGGFDASLIVLDQDLNITKQLSFGGSADDVAEGVVANADGSYTVVGNTASVGAGGADAFIATLGGDFSTITGSLAKYPALSIKSNGNFTVNKNFSLTVNSNPTLSVTNNPNLPLDTNPSLTIKVNPTGLIVDANAAVTP